jgi:hypothetical protein
VSACREGFDLLSTQGRSNFWRYLKRGRFQRLMWRDTFGRLLCWLSGDHVIHQDWSTNNTPETSCRCCMRWLKQEGYKWLPK